MSSSQFIAVFIFCATMIFIMTEKVHRMTAALAGAIMMILCGILTIKTSMNYIDGDTICILVGMMLFVSTVKKSGLFEFIAVKAAKMVRGRPWAIMVVFMIITAVLSAFLDNVTTVLLIGPMTFAITKALGLNPVPFIMTQIMASNIGGTSTLIGDPPNIMIGSAADLGFMDFVFNVGPPVLIVLAVYIVCFYFIYGRKEKVSADRMKNIMEMDERLLVKDKILMIKSVVMIVLMIIAFIFQDMLGLDSAIIALGTAVIMMIIGRQNIEGVVEGVEWTSIIFFIGLFVIVGGLQECGVINMLAEFIVVATEGKMFMTIVVILWASAILSAFLDNIPFVATMIPLILAIQASGVQVEPLWWALSLGACLGGNGTLIGASANVVLSGISAREGAPITFGQYFKVGFPMMILSIIVCTIYMFVLYGR